MKESSKNKYSQNFSIIKRNILLFLKSIGVSPAEFYRISGMSRGSLSNASGITEQNIYKFISIYNDIDLNWLINNDTNSTLYAIRGMSHVPKLIMYPRATDLSNLHDIIDGYYSAPSNLDYYFNVERLKFIPSINQFDTIGVQVMQLSNTLNYDNLYFIVSKSESFIRKVKLYKDDYIYKCINDQGIEESIQKQDVKAIYKICVVIKNI